MFLLAGHLQPVDDHVSVRTIYSYPGGVSLQADRLTFISARNANLRIVVFQPVPDTGAEHRSRRATDGGDSAGILGQVSEKPAAARVDPTAEHT